MMKDRKKLSAPFLAALGAGVLAGVLFLSFLLSSGLLHERGTGITMPDGEQDAPVISEGSQMLTAQSVAEIEITTENAQRVIASLLRPETYSCRIENTLYYSGGESTVSARRYALGGVVRTDALTAQNAVQSTLLRKGDRLYAWNTGETTWYQGRWGEFSEDAAAMLPTYEDVLGEDITLLSAEKQDIGSEPCIRVEFEQGGYRCEYAVSASSGLLKSASFYDAGTLVRQVQVSELELNQPDKELFCLPSGQTLLED